MAISFSGSAKAETCRNIPVKKCCALAECFGILLFCNTFTCDSVKIVTESREFGQFLPKLFKKAFNVNFDVFPSLEAPGKLVFQIIDPEKIGVIMETFGFGPASTLALHVNLPVLEDDCCKAAFLRGAFLAGGSVTDPEKGYHLEMTTTHQSVARETYALIDEVLGFAPKLTDRNANAVLYLKQSERISDFLTYLGSSIAAMAIMEARLEKEMSNKMNRRCNCDDANISKVVDAAQEQLAAIRVLRDRGIFENLPEKLRQAAVAREKNPESALTELASQMDPPISKPAMNHRLQRLVRMAQEVGV